MRTVISATLICCLLLTLATATAAYAADQNQLIVNYTDNVAEPYVVMVDSGDRYTISQAYSWVRDETSRYNLVSYSIDGDSVEISRKARGNFALDVPMDSSHSVTFFAVVQYPVSVSSNNEGLTIDFSPSSPTHDNWFDASSEVTVSVPYNTGSSGSRQQLASWSIDKSAKRMIQIDDGSENFTTMIRMSGPYNIEFISKTQYYVDVVSEYGTVTGTGWYDAGETATISIKPPSDQLLIRHDFVGWEGSAPFEGYSSASILVDSPKILIAKWTTDYSQLFFLVIGIAGAAGAATVTKRMSKPKPLPPMTAPVMVHDEARATSMMSIPSPSVIVPQQGREAIIKLQADENNTNYQNQIMTYSLEKSIEKLEAFRASGLISDAKLSRIKGKLEETFH